MTKDIKITTSYHSRETSDVVVRYGDKQIFSGVLWDDDVTELEAALTALQNEILKDALKAPPIVVNNFVATPATTKQNEG